MIRIDETLKLDEFAALREVVKALELRFPEHNGPFEYGTRLAEEAGELMEALYEARDGIKGSEQKQHLVKEQQDVLRVALGIIEVYNLGSLHLSGLDEFNRANDPENVIAYIALIGTKSGQLASAINHAEGMGIKQDKHGNDALRRVRGNAAALMQVVLWTVRYFNTEDALKEQIAESYRDYRKKGYISG